MFNLSEETPKSSEKGTILVGHICAPDMSLFRRSTYT
jgi:hypothetical protein